MSIRTSKETIEIITSVERRRRWSASEKARIVIALPERIRKLFEYDVKAIWIQIPRI